MKNVTLREKNRFIPIVLSLLVAFCLLIITIIPGNAHSIPLISVVSVEKNVSVTISGVNFPTGRNFTVRMGPYGSLGIGGTIVGVYDSSLGSSFTATYAIPSSLAGANKIAIRLESGDGFYSYNWFVNDSAAVPTAAPVIPSGYYGYPTFDITAVTAGSTVTILTHNMPAGQSFTVRMGEYGTLALGGTIVGTTVDTGGSFSATFNIPSWLAGQARIAIRMDGPTGYYAFNWFYNTSTSPAATPIALETTIPVSTPIPLYTPVSYPTPVPGYYGIPTIWISSVVKDLKVTIYANNFPSGQTFNVRMGAYGTYGAGGILVTTQDSGSGGAFTATYDIPAALAGSGKIAIRLETPNGYYYAYNWFYNTTTY